MGDNTIWLKPGDLSFEFEGRKQRVSRGEWCVLWAFGCAGSGNIVKFEQFPMNPASLRQHLTSLSKYLPKGWRINIQGVGYKLGLGFDIILDIDVAPKVLSGIIEGP